MPMERREARSVAQGMSSPEVCEDGPFKGYARLHWIEAAARVKPDEKVHALMHHLNPGNLRRAFRELDGSKAVGIDRVTKRQYAEHLDGNIAALHGALRGGGWRPKPSRQVLIPKPQGGMRPLAVGCLEDKIVQTLVARILEALYEPTFSRHSFGFRRGKSAHQAVGRLHETIRGRSESCSVVEMDIEKFFDSVDHDWLLAKLETKIADPHFLRLIRRLLRSSLLTEDGIKMSEVGTAQGSPVSPVLANICLHYLLDEWFQEHFGTTGRMVRYADDAVFVFVDADTADVFRQALAARLAEAGLRLNLDKSGIVPFSKSNPKGTVAFLGFEFYWGRNAAGHKTLKVKTKPKRLARSVQAFKEWVKFSRNRMKLDKLWSIASAKLRGHFSYFGVMYNEAKLNHFYYACTGLLFRWLNRRSQRRSFTWERYEKRLYFSPLPLPPCGGDLKDITSERSSSKHSPKSRMRKIRTSGSVRSAGRQRPAFT
jgi:RNA-directed DNA polymerase